MTTGTRGFVESINIAYAIYHPTAILCHWVTDSSFTGASYNAVYSFCSATRTMALKSFVDVHPNSHFPIQNLPYGAFKPWPSCPARLGVAIGEYVLDLFEITKAGLFNGPILWISDCFLQVWFHFHCRGRENVVSVFVEFEGGNRSFRVLAYILF